MNRAYILIDTVSIQDYIFTSNKLSENIGASYIVENEIYNNDLFKSIKINHELIYSGGGNALIALDTNDLAIKFIQEYSLTLLESFPGLRTAYGIAVGDSTTEAGYNTLMTSLHLDLKKCKNEFFTNTNVFKSGLTDDCPRTNQAANISHEEQYISYGSESKERASNLSNESFKKSIKEICGSIEIKPIDIAYKFDELGQSKGKSFIGVVTLDGNGVGEQFKACKSISAIKDLSKDIKLKSQNIRSELFQFIINNMKTMYERDYADKKFPLRVLISGGDDLCFVCDGTHAIALAEKAIKLYISNGIEACAGISIVNTKFPFGIAYQSSKSLLYIAKSRAKNESPGYPSAIAYQIGKPDYQHTNINDALLLSEFDNLKNIMKEFIKKDTSWSKNKIMKYRELLDLHRIDINTTEHPDLKYFVESSMVKGITFPSGNNSDILKAIELLEFYKELNA